MTGDVCVERECPPGLLLHEGAQAIEGTRHWTDRLEPIRWNSHHCCAPTRGGEDPENPRVIASA